MSDTPTPVKPAPQGHSAAERARSAAADPWRAMTAAAALVAVLAVAWAVASGPRPQPEVSDASPLRFTLASSDPEGVRIVDGPIAISPDGSSVVFTGSVGGQRRLYRRALASPGLRPVSGAGEITRAPSIAFSPDGRTVAYAAYVDGEYSLRNAPLEGGRSDAVASLPYYPAGLGWSEAHGVIMGTLSSDFPDMYRAASGGSELIAMGAVMDGRVHRGPYVLEGGESALYLDAVDGVERLAILSLLGGERSLLDLGGASLASVPVVGVADGVLLYLDADHRLMAVAWNPVEQQPVGLPMPVPGVPGGLTRAALAADGTLAMLVGPAAYELLVVDERGNPEIVLSSERVRGAYVRFSPDGGRVAFASDLRGGATDLWTYEVASGLMSQTSLGYAPQGVGWAAARVMGTMGSVPDGALLASGISARAGDGSGEATILLAAPGWDLYGMDASRGGRWIAVAANQGQGRGAHTDIVVRDLVEDTAFSAFVSTEANEVAPRFSPDGRWLAYASDQSGVFQVYVRRFPGPGERVQVSDAGGGQPVWSPDGRRLFYQTEDAVVAALLEIDGERLSVTGRERLFRSVLYGGVSSSSASYDVNPEGTGFALTRAAGGRATEIVLWMDWLDELKPLLAERGR